MPHRRSPRALGRRYAANLSYHDRRRAENVCTVETSQVLEYLAALFPGDGVSPGDADFEKGEILVDSRGTGSLQHLAHEKKDKSLVQLHLTREKVENG